MFIGIKPEEKEAIPGLHSPEYQFDDTVLAGAAATFANIAIHGCMGRTEGKLKRTGEVSEWKKLVYVDRRNTNCNKWDGQQKMFGEEGLHAMWVADMDFRVPECVVSALREYVESGVYGYYKIPDAYYQAFIDWEREHHGYEVKKEWIRFSPGVVAGFHWLLQILTEENDAVIVNTPVYYPFLDAVKNNHRNLICSDLKNENGEYSIDFDDFEKKITDHQVKLFILCSPHNPAGRVWKKEELKRLFEICRAHQVYIISDEIHQDLVFGENKHIPSLSTGEYDDIMVSIVAASKTFNIAGAQNSMVIIPDEKLQEKWDAYVKATEYWEEMLLVMLQLRLHMQEAMNG